MPFRLPLMSTSSRISVTKVANRYQSYDALLNIGEEYHHIWKSKWGLIKCLYLWSRYGPFIDTTIAVLRGAGVMADLLLGVSPTSCNTLAKFNTVFSIFGIGVTEIILIIRTYALYGSSKKVLAFCMVVWLDSLFTNKSVGGICTWAAMTWSQSVVSGLNCSNILVACYVSLLVGETVIVLLTLRKLVHYKLSAAEPFRSSPLRTSFYRDECLLGPGIMFYVAILGEAFMSLGFLFSQTLDTSHFHWYCGASKWPPGKFQLFKDVIRLLSKRFDQTELKLIGLTPLRVMHSTLACQLVIHVRVVASEEETYTLGKSKPLLFANLQADNRCGVDTVI
ncbi:hypothetical protein B0H13DRAFT_1860625 [Mycena leptocephala]|nr:hypothetical protein B0H13DRAFT_1860625 [Mycena leptocephala]